MGKVIDFLKEIVIVILVGLFVCIIANVIGFLDSNSTLPVIIGMIAGVIVNRCYKITKKSKYD